MCLSHTGNSRNGTRPRTVITDAVGPIVIGVPRDRDGLLEPVIVKKPQQWLGQVDEIILSLTARGLTTGEVSAHFEGGVWRAGVSGTISRITGRVTEEMQSRGALGPATPGTDPALAKHMDEFIPFLDYPAEIGTVPCSTNVIESLNARHRRAIKARATSPQNGSHSSVSPSNP